MRISLSELVGWDIVNNSHRCALPFSAVSPSSCCCRLFLPPSTHADMLSETNRAPFDLQAPKTVENFRSLATGELGVNEKGVALHYKNTTFHRVVHGLLVQGGDILSKSSTPLTKVLS